MLLRVLKQGRFDDPQPKIKSGQCLFVSYHGDWHLCEIGYFSQNKLFELYEEQISHPYGLNSLQKFEAKRY